MLPKVYIEQEPILAMIWAAIEEFRKECVGFILGYRPTSKDNNFYVTATLPLQSVKRGRKGRALSEVEQSKRSRKCSEEFEKWLEAGRILTIGDFHSHTEYRDISPSVELSEFDKNNMDEDKIEILISVSSRSKGKKPWETFSDGRIAGSIGKYDFIFSAYMLEKKPDGENGENVIKEDDEKNVNLLQIVAPLAIKMLNRMQLKK